MMKFVEKMRIRWQLMFYYVVIYAIVITFIVTTYGLAGSSLQEFTVGAVAALLCLLVCRTVGKVYSMIIRYGGVHVYMRLFATDLIALCFYWPLKYGLGLEHMTSQRWLIIMLLNLLGAVGMRLMYRYCYSFGVRRTRKGDFLRFLLLLFAGDNVIKERRNESKRIRIAILGAGRLGAVLADELLSNDSAAYVPVCFIDQNPTKTGREVMGLPVLREGEDGLEDLKDYGVQEIVFAITNIINTKKDTLFKLYN